MTVPRRFHHTGPLLLRASTCPSDVAPPGDLDPTDSHAMTAWLAELWTRDEIRDAVELASPVLAASVNRLLAANRPSVRRLRRAAASVAAYMLRWQRRATPFGTFAGVTTVEPGPTGAKFGARDRTVVRADGEWLSGAAGRLEQNHDIRMRLTVVTDNTGTVRDGAFVVARRAQLGARSPGPLREASVRLTNPVSFALDQATEPVRLATLAERMAGRFPSVATHRIHGLLHGLIDGGFLITGLRASTTEEDPLGHLIQELHAADIHDACTQRSTWAAELLDRLEAISAQIARHNATSGASEAPETRASITTMMRAVSVDDGPALAADVRLDARITLPEQVVDEAERAADVLLRLSTQPFGTAAWMDYHSRFRARYGQGALVPIRDLLADSGLGYPHGYLGAPRARPAWRTLTERDATLMAMIQRATMDGSEEITLTNTDIEALTVGDHTAVVAPPRAELGVTVHAASAEAIDRGDFELRVVAAPRAHTSMLGRFAYLLDEADRDQLARGYAQGDTSAVSALLSFPPRRPHNDNVVRVRPYNGTAVLRLGEHPAPSVHAGPERPGPPALDLDDLAVTADASQMYLVQRSTSRRVVAHIPHALDTIVQTPPPARFLAEVADARSAVFGPLDLGAARTLPYVPRIRYRRAVLSPARWLLTNEDLPVDEAFGVWETGLRRWRTRWKVPARVITDRPESRLPLNLDHAFDRWLLRSQLGRDEQIELREDGPGNGEQWIGRPAELVIPMITDGRSRRLPVTASPGPMRHPGDGDLLRAHLIGSPARFDTLLTRHLPRVIAELNATDHVVARWWAGRHRDLIRPEADQYLVVLLRLTNASHYGQVATHLNALVRDLHGRGLPAQLDLTAAEEHFGRYGHGSAMEAAEEVFATDTASAIAQIAMAEATGIDVQAITAASMTHIAAGFALDLASGYQAMTTVLEPGASPVDRGVRDQALRLADPTSDFEAVRALPDGDVVAAAWQARTAALTAYRHALAEQRDPEPVLATLFHDHHVRVFGVDPNHETAVGRLARAAAIQRLALVGAR